MQTISRRNFWNKIKKKIYIHFRGDSYSTMLDLKKEKIYILMSLKRIKKIQDCQILISVLHDILTFTLFIIFYFSVKEEKMPGKN